MNDHLLSRFLIVLTSISACAGDSNVTLTSTSLIPSTRPSRQLASHLNEFCATGIVSLHAKYTRHLCCGAQCGSCGSSQEDCAKRGESECCVEFIISKWRSCVGPNDTGCIIPLDLCRYGIKSDDGILCCGGACEECGDAHRGCKISFFFVRPRLSAAFQLGKPSSSRSRNRSANTLPLVYSCSHECKRRPSSLHDLIPTHIIQVPKKLEGVLSAASEISSRAVSSARDQLIQHASFQSQQQKSETINTKEKTRTKMRKL